MALEYFPCFYSYRKKIAKLSDQEVGRLFRHLLEYGETGETEELAGREAVAFDFIADDIDRAKAEYLAKCEKNRANGSERKRTDANATERYRTLPNGSERTQTKTEDKTEDKTEEESKKKRVKEKADAFSSFAGDNEELLSALRDFESMRKQIRKPMTDRAKELLVCDLEKFERSLWIPILEQSIKNCWQGIFPLKQEAPQKKPGYNMQHHSDALTDVEREAVRRMMEDDDEVFPGN